MLWLKVFHIVFVVSWFSALFYLPRIFVNLAMVPAGSDAERERLLLMARKLYRFSMWLSVPVFVFGIWLWLGYGFKGGWLHAKIALALLVVGYNHYCGGLLRAFAQGRNVRSHTWYRIFNELPVLALVVIVILVVVKPF